MLDKRTHLLLSRIVALCADGTYKIVEESEMLSCFPVNLKTDADGVKAMVRYLRENGYIDVKYAEDGVYCLSPLPEGRMYDERARARAAERFRGQISALLFTFLGAFLGAFAGAGLLSLIVSLAGGV